MNNSDARPDDYVAELNEQLEQANETLRRTVSERDELTAVVAHDVRAPLHVISGFAETIATLDGERLSAPSRDFLQRIQRHVRELEALVDDLVLGSRLGADAVRAEPTDVDLSALAAEQAQELVGTPTRVEAPSAAIARVDERHARRVLANLLSNAQKHGEPPIEVGVRDEGDRIAVSVTDHGPGVPPEVAQRLFQRFAGGDSADVDPGSGAGLGLSIVADLVRLNGGTVTHENLEPTGARFTVRFRAAHARNRLNA